jgi:hypothetical protein
MPALDMREPREGRQERGCGREAICSEHARGACCKVYEEKRLVSMAGPALLLTRGGPPAATRGPPLFFGLYASRHACLCAPCQGLPRIGPCAFEATSDHPLHHRVGRSE